MNRTYKGTIEGVYIGEEHSARSEKVSRLELTWDGAVGDRHYGRTKRAGVRESYTPKGTELLNLRQVSIVSQEELAEVADLMELDEIHPEELGANILVSGIPNFTSLPFGSILQFPNSAMIMLSGDNYPCIHPGLEIEKRTKSGAHKIFAKKAIHKRGQTGICLQPGIIEAKMEVTVVIPKEVGI